MTYHLPLMGHDMPEAAPLAPERHKARVFRAPNGRWSWEHQCADDRARRALFSCQTQPGALREALGHLAGCR